MIDDAEISWANVENQIPIFFSSVSPDKFFYNKVPFASTADLKNETQVGPIIEYSFLVCVTATMKF